MSQQTVDPHAVIVSSRVGQPPVAIQLMVTKNADHVGGGVPEGTQTPESYVRLNALPDELRARVVTTVQALMAGM